jgi:hypothetical protein
MIRVSQKLPPRTYRPTFLQLSNCTNSSHSYHLFKSLRESGKMHCAATLLPGKILSGAKALFSRDWLQVGIDKYSTFLEYTKLYPEYQ